MDISTRQLKSFVELAECLNFTRAALNLHIAQPALSQQIAELEKQLDVRLFNRTSRSVSLTPAGAILYEEARNILSEINDLHARLQRAESGESGHIRIGFLNAPFKANLPKLLRLFSSLYPDVRIEMQRYNVGELYREIDKGRIDIGFCLCFDGDRSTDQRYSSILLDTEDLCIAISGDHPFAASGGLDYSLLSSSTLLIPDEDEAPGFSEMVLGVCLERHISPRSQSFAGNIEAVLLKADAEMGFSILPSCVAASGPSNVTFIPVRSGVVQSKALWKADSSNASLDLLIDSIYSSLEDPDFVRK